jgi:hypothetical protein
MHAATAVVRPDVDLNVDETEDFKCRACGLEIGPYLREEEPNNTIERDLK